VTLSSDGPIFREYDKNDRSTIVIAPENIHRQVEEYFGIVGSKQGPSIGVSNIDRYRSVQFSFWLPKNVQAGLIYSPEGNANWQFLEKNWYIFSYGMV
jgi:hypothetical protein